jgi:hypothetical protein
VAQLWLNCQMHTSVYAPKTITEAPVASPSSPSVRFTALLVPDTISSTQITTSSAGSCHACRSRMKEMYCAAGSRPVSSGNCSARNPNTTAIAVCPAIFALLRRPRLRCLEILMKSSRNPTRPSPANRNSSSIADTDGHSAVNSLAPR